LGWRAVAGILFKSMNFQGGIIKTCLQTSVKAVFAAFGWHMSCIGWLEGEFRENRTKN